MPDDHGFGHVGAGAQQALDERRRQRLAARGDDEIARTVDQFEPAILEFADIAGAQPSVLAEHFAGHAWIVPVAVEKEITAYQDLVGGRQSHLDAGGDGADVAWPRKRAPLTRDNRACLLGLAVDLAEVHAPHLPERHGLRRQRRAARYDELQCVEAKFLEHRSEHERPRGAVSERFAAVAVPARARLGACDPHRDLVGGTLCRRGVADGDQHLRGKFLQVAWYREQHRRRDLEKSARQVLNILTEMRHQL